MCVFIERLRHFKWFNTCVLSVLLCGQTTFDSKSVCRDVRTSAAAAAESHTQMECIRHRRSTNVRRSTVGFQVKVKKCKKTKTFHLGVRFDARSSRPPTISPLETLTFCYSTCWQNKHNNARKKIQISNFFISTTGSVTLQAYPQDIPFDSDRSESH